MAIDAITPWAFDPRNNIELINSTRALSLTAEFRGRFQARCFFFLADIYTRVPILTRYRERCTRGVVIDDPITMSDARLPPCATYSVGSLGSESNGTRNVFSIAPLSLGSSRRT